MCLLMFVFFRFYGRLRLGLFVWKRLKSRKGHDFIYVFFKFQSLCVRWGYVTAHKGIRGNEGADELAKSGATRFNRKRKH